jgi:hypothetical protein
MSRSASSLIRSIARACWLPGSARRIPAAIIRSPNRCWEIASWTSRAIRARSADRASPLARCRPAASAEPSWRVMVVKFASSRPTSSRPDTGRMTV